MVPQDGAHLRHEFLAIARKPTPEKTTALGRTQKDMLHSIEWRRLNSVIPPTDLSQGNQKFGRFIPYGKPHLQPSRLVRRLAGEHDLDGHG